MSLADRTLTRMGIVYVCVVLETAVLHCQEPRSSLDTKSFALATRGAMYCRHQRLVELEKKYFNKVMNFVSPVSMQRTFKV